jgi:hypothetical protein
VQALLTDQAKAALTRLIQQLEREAQRLAVPLASIEVTSFTDPDDDSHEIVVRETVCLPAEKALDYWDELAQAIETWLTSLPPTLADLINSQFAVEVAWDTDGSSV